MHLIGGLLGRPLASLTKHNGRARENHPDDRRGRGAERQVPKPLDTMMRESPEHQTAAASGGADGRSWLTWPNVVTCIRIVGSPGLVVLAMFGQLAGLGALAVALVFTEWLDGFLARALHQESATGARLDTVADAVFYSSLLVAVAALNPQLVLTEIGWIIVAIGSYLLSWLASWVKFHRLPSYHTWAAKGVWVPVGIGIVCLALEWTAWPFRIAMTCVGLANLEAVAITVVLKQCRVDVRSIMHAQLKDRTASLAHEDEEQPK